LYRVLESTGRNAEERSSDDRRFCEHFVRFDCQCLQLPNCAIILTHTVLLQLLCFFLILIVAVYVQYKQICESGIGSEIEWHRTFLIYMDLVECQYQRSPPPISAALFYDDFCCYRITVSPNLLKV